jgi:protein XRP2
MIFLTNVLILKRDARKSSDPSDFMIENRKNETIVKLPGTLNGTQFIIQNLDVYLQIFTFFH